MRWRGRADPGQGSVVLRNDLAIGGMPRALCPAAIIFRKVAIGGDGITSKSPFLMATSNESTAGPYLHVE